MTVKYHKYGIKKHEYNKLPLIIKTDAVTTSHIAANVIATADFATSGLSIATLTVGATADFSGSEIMGVYYCV